MWGHLKFMYEAPNWNALNRSMQSQTTACISKSSCEICSLMRYYAAQSANSLPMCQDNPSPLLQSSRNPKENTAQLKLLTIFFILWGGDFVHCLIFFLRSTIFQKPTPFLFSGKQAPNLVHLLIDLFSITAPHGISNLLRYAPEKKFSPQVVTGKWLLKILKLPTRL